MVNLNQQIKLKEKGRLKKRKPLYNRTKQIFSELYKDFLAVFHSFVHGPYYPYPSVIDLKYLRGFEPHYKELIIQIELKEETETKIFLIEINKKYLDQYICFEAIPKELKNQLIE
ncbi:MAG: hypothetical protein ABIG11_00900 [bacterium]